MRWGLLYHHPPPSRSSSVLPDLKTSEAAVAYKPLIPFWWSCGAFPLMLCHTKFHIGVCSQFFLNNSWGGWRWMKDTVAALLKGVVVDFRCWKYFSQRLAAAKTLHGSWDSGDEALLSGVWIMRFNLDEGHLLFIIKSMPIRLRIVCSVGKLIHNCGQQINITPSGTRL